MATTGRGWLRPAPYPLAPSAELIYLEIHRVVGLTYTHRAAHNVEREVQVAFLGRLIRGPRVLL